MSLSIRLKRVIPLILFAGNNYRVKGPAERRRVEVRNGAGGTAGSDILSAVLGVYIFFLHFLLEVLGLCAANTCRRSASHACSIHKSMLLAFNRP